MAKRRRLGWKFWLPASVVWVLVTAAIQPPELATFVRWVGPIALVMALRWARVRGSPVDRLRPPSGPQPPEPPPGPRHSHDENTRANGSNGHHANGQNGHSMLTPRGGR